MSPSQELRCQEERKQSLSRLGISATAFFTLITANLIHDGYLSRTLINGLTVLLIHFCFSLAWNRFITLKPLAWPNRIYVSMLLDISTTTLAFFFAAKFAAIFYPIFLWIIVGYGLRFGKQALIATALAAFIEFGLVLKFSSFWHANALAGLGFWWGILILPAFFLTVLNRMNTLNSKLEVELNNAQAAEKAKGEFLANMSHEIRTPLNGVLGMAQILEDSSIDQEGHKHLAILRRSADSLLGIVNDILDFSKITSGKMLIESVPFDLRHIVEDIVQIMQPAAKDGNLKLVGHYPDHAPTGFIGDPTRIRQVILNLVSNAVKFTKSGSVTIRVRVQDNETDQSTVDLFIEDTGIGIPAERLPLIFEEFEQVDVSTTRNFGGTGLGLAISRHLVRKMGGEIAVQSELDKGSVFHVNLTLPVSSLASKKRKTHVGCPQFQLSVLVAEDNAVNQLVIRKLLKKMGITPDFADNGLKAIAAIENKQYDLVFMDVRMPVMDGLEATALIRKRSDALADLPIIALTADADADSARRCLEAGMNLHLGKPVILDQAVAAIESLNIPVAV